MKLFLKTALFTVLMPGTFAGLLPVLVAGGRTAVGGAGLGLAACGILRLAGQGPRTASDG